MNQKKLSLLNLDYNTNCLNCWAKHLCKDCPGFYYAKFSNISFSEEYCNAKRKSIENFLIDLILIRKIKQVITYY
jgi:hypothetical protein